MRSPVKSPWLLYVGLLFVLPLKCKEGQKAVLYNTCNMARSCQQSVFQATLWERRLFITQLQSKLISCFHSADCRTTVQKGLRSHFWVVLMECHVNISVLCCTEFSVSQSRKARLHVHSLQPGEVWLISMAYTKCTLFVLVAIFINSSTINYLITINKGKQLFAKQYRLNV